MLLKLSILNGFRNLENNFVDNKSALDWNIIKTTNQQILSQNLFK